MTYKQNWMVKSAASLLAFFTIVTSSQAADFKKGTYSATAGGVKFSIKYDDTGKVTVTRNGEVVVEGTYKVMGDAIEISDEKGQMACGGEQKTGKYKWKLEGKNLTLTKVEDGCEGRASALTSQTWVQE